MDLFKVYITRAADSSWLYSSSIGIWWTMGAYSNIGANYVQYGQLVITDGALDCVSGSNIRVVRPVITIRK